MAPTEKADALFGAARTGAHLGACFKDEITGAHLGAACAGTHLGAACAGAHLGAPRTGTHLGAFCQNTARSEDTEDYGKQGLIETKDILPLDRASEQREDGMVAVVINYRSTEIAHKLVL